jgi:uncharacterized repeat protein (TIGR03803 family)
MEGTRMPNNKAGFLFATALTFLLVLLGAAHPVFAQNKDKERVLRSFTGIPDGQSPVSSLIFDAAGNLYGTTESGGTYVQGCFSPGCGTVFQLTLGSDGKWKEKVLHVFTGPDGIEPGAGLVFDTAGNLYGTTMFAGAYAKACGGLPGCGTVFQLTPRADGKWKEEVLHSFNGKDGEVPEATLIFDAAGNLYGTTPFGGANGVGTVFELTPGTNGKWKEKVLHNFGNSISTDGENPYEKVVFDQEGNLYGTTTYGGNFDGDCAFESCGTVFRLVPEANGKWKEEILLNFSPYEDYKDGIWPISDLVIDGAGNLYGTTSAGGVTGGGVVFQLAQGADGKWKEKVLHTFTYKGPDGDEPFAGLVFDAAGNLYGTTAFGGVYGQACDYFIHGCGTVFKLTPASDGKWNEKVVHSFDGKDGELPSADLIFDAAGNLYGTTSEGGVMGIGTVFQLTP